MLTIVSMVSDVDRFLAMFASSANWAAAGSAVIAHLFRIHAHARAVLERNLITGSSCS